MKLLSRILTAAILIASAVTAGVWLARPPLAAATARQTKIVSEPAEAPLPIPAPIPAVPVVRPTTPTIIEVPVEVEIAVAAPVAESPPTMSAAEPKPKPQSNYPPARRGLFRRR
jgi:hypothetical protein